MSETGNATKQPPDGEAITAKPPPVPEEPASVAGRSSLREDLWLLWQAARGRPEKKIAGWLSAGLVVITVLNLIGQIRLNNWNGTFFDAIGRKDFAAFGYQLLVFLVIVVFLLTFVVAQTWLQERLKISIRAWIAGYLMDRWLSPYHAYRLGFAGENGAAPDQRIQEDTRIFADYTAELGTGFMYSSLQLVGFIGILWGLSAGIQLPAFGKLWDIPGYMVWCAIIYAALGSLLTWKVGFPLIQLNAQRYAREAEFRFALVRVNESAESISLYGGETDERRQLQGEFDKVLKAMRRLSASLARLTWITSGYGWIALVVPMIIASPGYFGGALTLGGMMMVVGAFNQVQASLRWFVDHFPQIADWRAALHRVTRFREALSTIDDPETQDERIQLRPHPDGLLSFRNVDIHLADGSVVIAEANVDILEGERVLIVGESGSGKSTLFRALGGLWPWGSGEILAPPASQMMFLPQRPYLPLGTLKAAACYPQAGDFFTDEQVIAAFERCGLEQFTTSIHKAERWDKSLSLGQQQRLGFARLLLHRPKWVFMDEATAALDDMTQSKVMSLFENELKDVTILSIGHRPGLDAFHGRTIQVVTSPSGARLRRRAARHPVMSPLQIWMAKVIGINVAR